MSRTTKEALDELRSAVAEFRAEIERQYGIGSKLASMASVLPVGAWYILLAGGLLIATLPEPPGGGRMIMDAYIGYFAIMGLYRLFARR